MAKRSRRRYSGLVPALLRGVWAAARAAVRHPQWVAAVLILAAAAAGLARVAAKTDAFRITAVQWPADVRLAIRQPLIGRNLWTLDLRALAAELHAQAPSLKFVRVVRRLPGTLGIEAVRRVPVAEIRLGQRYGVDAEGVVFPMESAPPGALVRLVGLEQAARPIKPGHANADERLMVALRVLQRLRRHPALAGARLTDLNAADPQHLRFVLDDTTEIRCGSEAELPAQLDRLRAALRVITARQVAARYIDVRFTEPVVGQAT